MCSDPIPNDFVAGLENAKWPGRCQTVLDPNYSSTTWYLDGAHTDESLKCCIQWFVHPNATISESVSVIRCLILSNDVGLNTVPPQLTAHHASSSSIALTVVQARPSLGLYLTRSRHNSQPLRALRKPVGSSIELYSAVMLPILTVTPRAVSRLNWHTSRDS